GGGDGDDVLLIGEVDARFDEGEEGGEFVGPGAVFTAGLAGGEAGRGGEVVVGLGGDGGGDPLGLVDAEAAAEGGTRGELAGGGVADAGAAGDGGDDAFEEVGVAGEEDLGGVVAGEGVAGGVAEEEDRERGRRGIAGGEAEG